MPRSRSFTEILLLMAAYMVEPCDVAPPLRQAFSLTIYSSVSLMRPSLSSLNTYSTVISLPRLAGKISSSASRANSTAPFSASIKMACGALIGSSSFFAASFLAAAFFCACAATAFCFGAANETLHRLAAKAAAVSNPNNCKGLRRIGLARTRDRVNGGDLTENCGSVKAAAAHKPRRRIIACRGVGGNRRNCRFSRPQGLAHDGFDRVRPSGSREFGRRPVRRCLDLDFAGDLAGALAQPIRPLRW